MKGQYKRLVKSRIKNGASPISARIYALKTWIKSTFSQKRFDDVIFGLGLFDRPLLMSYSRSGTNWIRYFIEVVSGKATPGQYRVHRGKKYVIDRAHAGYETLHNYKKVLFILRNYKECLVRHHGIAFIREKGGVANFLTDNSLSQPAAWYWKNIAAFERFKGEKLLIYYEDLIDSPEITLKQMGTFLSLDSAKVADFLNNLERHRADSVKAYTKFGHQSNTQGDPNKTSYHSQTLSQQEVEIFDQHFAEQDPLLFKKYLNRYQQATI